MNYIWNAIVRRRSTALMIRKTDDEVTRYLKQQTLMKRRAEIEEDLSFEDRLAKEQMDTWKIRRDHYKRLEALDKTSYDKNYLNDNEMEYKFLNDPQNYKPLGQRFRFGYLKPFYARSGDYSSRTAAKTYLIRVFGGLVLLKLGFELGKLDSVDTDLEKQTVVEYETEEQIFDYLYNQDKAAVFLQLYIPGQNIFDAFNNVFERESSKYQDKDKPGDDIVFMRVHCRKHTNFCVNKMWAGRILPAAEVYYINEKDEMELVDFDNKHRSAAGIESFFVTNGLREDKFDPHLKLERAGERYLQIL